MLTKHQSMILYNHQIVRRLIKNLLFPTLKALLYHHQIPSSKMWHFLKIGKNTNPDWLEVNRLVKISGADLIPVFDAKTVHVKIKSAAAKVKPSVKPSSGIVMKIL
ncbi:uncharacterized protein LOC117123018 isoform X3 [Anneissia japonica]|uniref:uncharacterized protein LOC117123018 isoform X3 n=1 Tax=Anneissia japonica TaxID=1529436 RepID=UPI0014256D66|nr:uncharacterized protein LOC117123018 isoform X3 [Anneissia japonica]